MAHENEQSLQKRPELIPELLKGGLIVGGEATIRGSLIGMTGMALERITRERSEVPPEQRLPENAVYFLDPEANRLVMVSRRDGYPQWKSGLFAETVELDDEGRPRFRLSTKEVVLPTGQYQMVAVGPNSYGMPPSHIHMVEEEIPGQEKFVPWNVYLAQLQSWMNEVAVDPNEDFETFMNKFHDLKSRSTQEVKNKIRTVFLGGPQGFDESVAPFNLVITDDVNKELYMDASRDAGLFPAYVSVKDFILVDQNLPPRDEDIDKFRQSRGMFGEWKYNIGHYLPADWGSEAKRYTPAVITHDWSAVWRLEDSKKEEDRKFVRQVTSPAAIHSLRMQDILKSNPIFSYVTLMRDEDGDPMKEGNGSYHCPNTQETYREFLYKIKSDLLLTMFVRGGAPIVK